jgi:molybdate transport system substrate-binding protein
LDARLPFATGSPCPEAVLPQGVSRAEVRPGEKQEEILPKQIVVWTGEKARRIRLGIFLAGMLSLFAGTGHAATIKVMCDSPLEPALTKVADVFRQETNNQVTLACNAGPAIRERIEGGEVADVVVVEPDFVEALTKSGKVRAGDRPMIGHVGVGLGNRIDSPAYDISTVEKLRTTLLGADVIVFNSVKSGQAFAAVLERLGIAETLKPKIVRTTPLGIFDPVLKGKGNDMAAGTIPLIATTPGIKLLGPLPGDLQSSIPYTAGLMTSAPQPATAKSFIAFLVSPKAEETFAANGVTVK